MSKPSRAKVDVNDRRQAILQCGGGDNWSILCIEDAGVEDDQYPRASCVADGRLGGRVGAEPDDRRTITPSLARHPPRPRSPWQQQRPRALDARQARHRLPEQLQLLGAHLGLIKEDAGDVARGAQACGITAATGSLRYLCQRSTVAVAARAARRA